MDILYNFLKFDLINVDTYSIKVYKLLILLGIFFIAKGILWFIKKILKSRHSVQSLDEGNAYAIFQIIRYILWTIAIILGLETLGVKITILLAGSAALLVGVGLGLQELFKDIISGIIILTEGTVKVNDIIESDGDIINVQSIGLRTLKGLTRDDIVIVIPNSQIITNKVINWSHQSKRTRFKINVGVAYGSNVDLVTKALTESVLEHPEIDDGDRQNIEVRFLDFGNSSLDFQVLFFSKDVFKIEKIKGEIRRTINQKFIEFGITIPFPQMDVHMKQ